MASSSEKDLEDPRNLIQHPSASKKRRDLIEELKKELEFASRQASELDTATKYVKLYLWSSGFVIDNGDLRSYNEPQNKKFMEQYRKGEIPFELKAQANGKNVHIVVYDYSEDDYVPDYSPVEETRQAYTGKSFRLENTSVESTPFTDKKKEKGNADKDGKEIKKRDEKFCCVVDKSKPITCVKIRLANGTNIMMNANHFHTVGDIKRFILEARPEFSASEFSIMTYQIKELDDEATLEEAHLLNSVVIQKLN